MIHENYNVSDLERSIKFYNEALDLHEVRRKTTDDFIKYLQMLFLFGSDCLLFTWECVLRLFSKCIAGFSGSLCSHGVSGLKQGSCRCDRTHQYPSCSAVNIYQAFTTDRWSHKCFGWSFYGKFKVWWLAYGKANKHEQSDYKQRKLIFALFLSENSNSILESLLSIM